MAAPSTSLTTPAGLGAQLAAGSPDLLQVMVKTFAEVLMATEAEALCGAEYGERSDTRVNSRNGYRAREWDTRAGTIELSIPKPRRGSFYPATVLTDCTDDMAVVQEETFGPVAPVIVVDSFEQALDQAACSDYGLAATVLTADLGRSQRAWHRLPFGTVKINDVLEPPPVAPPIRAAAAARGTATARNCSTR